MNVRYTHATHHKQIVLSVVGILTLVTAGLMLSQATNALSLQDAVGALKGTTQLIATPATTTNTSSTTTSSKAKTATTSTTTTPTDSTTTDPVTTVVTAVTTPAATTPTTSATPTPTTPSAAVSATSASDSDTSSDTVTSATPYYYGSQAASTPVAAPIDTAAQVAATAKAQTIGASTKITYQSNKMNPETATIIYRAAGLAAVVAFAMLASTSFIPPLALAFSKRQNAYNN